MFQASALQQHIAACDTKNRDDLCLITMEDETASQEFSQNHFVHQRPSTGAKKISNTASEGHYFATPVMQTHLREPKANK